LSVSKVETKRTSYLQRMEDTYIRFQLTCIVFSLIKIALKVRECTKMSLISFLERHVANQQPKNMYVRLEKHLEEVTLLHFFF